MLHIGQALLASAERAASVRLLEAITAQFGPRSAAEFAARPRTGREGADFTSQYFPYEHDPIFAKEQG